MTATFALFSPKRRLNGRADDGPSRSARAAWTSEGLHRVEIVAPDEECACLLVEYASPLFPTELLTTPELRVRLQPPPTGAGWVIELLSLVERWLESTPLPCAKVLYGGRSYLIRASTDIARLAVTGPATTTL